MVGDKEPNIAEVPFGLAEDQKLPLDDESMSLSPSAEAVPKMTLLQLVLRLLAQTQRPLAERGRDGRDRLEVG